MVRPPRKLHSQQPSLSENHFPTTARGGARTRHRECFVRQPRLTLRVPIGWRLAAARRSEDGNASDLGQGRVQATAWPYGWTIGGMARLPSSAMRRRPLANENWTECGSRRTCPISSPTKHWRSAGGGNGYIGHIYSVAPNVRNASEAATANGRFGRRSLARPTGQIFVFSAVMQM